MISNQATRHPTKPDCPRCDGYGILYKNRDSYPQCPDCDGTGELIEGRERVPLLVRADKIEAIREFLERAVG